MKLFNKLTNYYPLISNLNKVMKILLACLTFVMFFGCGALPDNIKNSTVTTCPETPKGFLDTKNVKPISLSTQIVKVSGQASADTSVAYTFEAKAGQKLSSGTKDTICVWIYTPDNQLLNSEILSKNGNYSGILPKDGNYILQVSALQGSTTFDLEMSLGTLQASSPPVVISTSTATATSQSNSNSNSSSNSTSIGADLTQDEALEIVENWYRAKPKIFAPPFDISLVEQYTTGKLYQDRTKPSGPIDWLRSNNAYYTYNYFHIDRVISFSNSGEKPSLILVVSEELYLHGTQGIDKSNSGRFTNKLMYVFAKDNGIWKIYDYQKIR